MSADKPLGIVDKATPDTAARHQHPAAFLDRDGRCLICGVGVRIGDLIVRALDREALLAEAAEALRAVTDALASVLRSEFQTTRNPHPENVPEIEKARAFLAEIERRP